MSTTTVRRATVDLQPSAPERARCKCCGAEARLYGVVDFNKSCEDRRARVFDLSGVAVYYHRCPRCRFIFTTAFDGFSKADFARHIYNEAYVLVDPDYAEKRPAACAAALSALFAPTRPPTLLDFGGGEGRLSALLREAGFPLVETYDPFVPRFADRPTRRYDCISCFEVLEHAPDPEGVLREMDALLSPGGMILFSTLLQPATLDAEGLAWWYAGPRNGHVSLYARESLLHLTARLGYTFASFDDNLHVLFKKVPAYAAHLIQGA